MHGASLCCRRQGGRIKVPRHSVFNPLLVHSPGTWSGDLSGSASYSVLGMACHPARPARAVAVGRPEARCAPFSALSPELFFLPCSLKALLIAQSELLSPRFPQPPEQLAFPLTWPLSSPSPRSPGVFTFQIVDSWVNFCFRREKDSLHLTMVRHWRRLFYLQL